MNRIFDRYFLVRCFISVSIALLLNHNKADAITIDEFDGNGSIQAVTVNVPVTTVTSSSTAIGGRRSLRTVKTGGPVVVSLSTITGFLIHDQGTQDTGISTVTWDGDDIADHGIPSNTNGLNNLDLTQDNGGPALPADAFLLRLTADLGFNQPIDIRMHVYSGNTKSSFATYTISADLNTPTDITIPFANFTQSNTPGVIGPADFTAVGAIVLEIVGTNPANDLQIDYLGTNGECPIIPINGNATKDQCGVCGGDNSSCSDCAGTPNGNALPGTACDTGDFGVCETGTYDGNCNCVPDKIPGPEQCDDSLDNDCDAEVDEIKTDQCGICGGDGQSCLDCAGMPFGTATKDECGVCQGDGTSCFSCDKIVTGDISTNLDHGAKLQEKLIRKMTKELLSRDRSKTTKQYAIATLDKAHQLQERNWILSWTLPPVIYVCSNSTVCFEQSNLGILTEYRAHSEELLNIGKEIIGRLKKAGIKATKYSKKNLKLHQSNIDLAATVPNSTSICVSYPPLT